MFNPPAHLDVRAPIFPVHQAREFSPPLVLFRNYIEGWSFFNINPSVARQPCKEVPELALGEAGEYLAAILHKLEKQNGEKGSLEQIVGGLRGAVPGFKNVRTKARGLS